MLKSFKASYFTISRKNSNIKISLNIITQKNILYQNMILNDDKKEEIMI